VSRRSPVMLGAFPINYRVAIRCYYRYWRSVGDRTRARRNIRNRVRIDTARMEAHQRGAFQ
jgi:hypothetical protein